jgi:hypothetical protein
MESCLDLNYKTNTHQTKPQENNKMERKKRKRKRMEEAFLKYYVVHADS